ncbi:MAG TPA: hypothetical protein VI894_00760 [Candidatus Nanoarchaeia archaeon]|nr:hypothetical protein [Candidatus Nanoarchaeia archaeon]
MKEFKELKKLESRLYDRIRRRKYSEEQEAMWIYESLIKLRTFERILIRKKIILPKEIAKEQILVFGEVIREMEKEG